MNKILLFLIIFTSVCEAQNRYLGNLPLKNGKVNYNEVIENKGVSKDEFYSRAKHWLLDNNIYPTDSLVNENKVKIYEGRDSFKVLWGPNEFKELYVDVYYSVIFEFRNSRYKYEITNFIVKETMGQTQLEIYKMKYKKNMKHNNLFYEKIDEHVKKLIESLERSMTIRLPQNK